MPASPAPLKHEAADQHRRDHRHRKCFEQVRCHARAVADVVADVIGDHRRIARIVFRNSGFDLADQIGADVGALGEYASAQPREDRNQRCAESKPDHRMQQFAHVGCRVRRAQHPVEAGDADQSESDHQQAGDRAAAERDVKRRVQARASRPARCAHWRAPTRSCRRSPLRRTARHRVRSRSQSRCRAAARSR